MYWHLIRVNLLGLNYLRNVESRDGMWGNLTANLKSNLAEFSRKDPDLSSSSDLEHDPLAREEVIAEDSNEGVDSDYGDQDSSGAEDTGANPPSSSNSVLDGNNTADEIKPEKKRKRKKKSKRKESFAE